MKNFKLTDETKTLDNGIILHRIECISKIPGKPEVKVGDKGGWVEKESNIDDNAWVYDNALVYGDARVYGDTEVYGDAKVYGDAWVSGNARVSDNAEVSGNAWVSDNAWVSGNARVSDNAEVSGNARVSDKAEVSGNARVSGNAEISGDTESQSKEDYIVFKNWWSSGRFFTWTRSNNMWRVGYFYGTGEELVAKAYKDSEKSGREYERVVKYVQSILDDERK